MNRLPDDLLADILRRLPARSMAACRTVCKGWRTAVDAGGMLLAVARLAPRHMRGFLVNYFGGSYSCFARGPTASPTIALDGATLGFMRRVGTLVGYSGAAVVDHRNGLLYMQGFQTCVCNPATRRWAELPQPPFRWAVAYLVFDPVVSLHYDVFLFPKTMWHRYDAGMGAPMEWPPNVYVVHVYSSTTNQWEKRPFLREGDMTMVTMWADRRGDPQRNAAHWRGALYLHCRSGLIIRYAWIIVLLIRVYS
jgi:hypothetical protein